MAHLLPCDADGVCMRCKVRPPDSDALLCDSCSSPWHMKCLDPPLEAVPAGSWSCPDCSDLAPSPCPGAGAPSSSRADVAANGAGGAGPGPASLAAKVRALQEDTSLDERERARRRQKLVVEHGRETALANGKGGRGKRKGDASPGAGRSGGKRKAGEVEGEEELAEEGRGNGKKEERVEVAEEEEEEESELEQAMSCGVCLEMVDRPITTPCGHNCCLKCFTKWVGQGNKKCPKCRALIPPRMISNPRINSALVAAIRFANAAKKAKATGGAAPLAHYKPLANAQRPHEAFTTERAKKTGRANACSGRIFVTVPPDHFGPITAEYDPVRNRGVVVGDHWADRLECRQWGAHFPHVAGIAGQSDYGAQSVALSGGYEDDQDEGEWFLYTGSGGRDLSGNKRTNKHHSFDQTFTAANEALRVSCAKGYPVRVVRSHKEKRTSYAPKEEEGGVRYDGVYRIERCWRKKGAGGFLVCRYLFVRCDNEAAPWDTKSEHGDRPRPLPEIEEMEEAQDVRERKGKPAWDWNEEKEVWEWVTPPPPSRKMGTPRSSSGTKRKTQTAHKRLLREFGCPLCKKVLTNPVSTPCAHNFCKACLEKRFAGTASCRERGPSGRALRVQKVMKACPAAQCTNDLADFLATMKVNLEMVDIIDLLRKTAEEEKKAAVEGEDEGGEGTQEMGEGEEGKEEGEGEEEVEDAEGLEKKEHEEEEREEEDLREVKADADLPPEDIKQVEEEVNGATGAVAVEELDEKKPVSGRGRRGRGRPRR